MKISFIICTYNRALILKENLLHIIDQANSIGGIEILIVDNNSSDSTSDEVKKIQSVFSNLKYVKENEIGLSHARNNGASVAIGEWLCYIDDDARLHSNYIERALWVTNNFDFDCFGGTYLGWFRFGKPKWIHKDFGTKILLRDTIGLISNPELSGNNFLIKRAILKRLGGFPTDYGMNGYTTAYAEENVVQVNLLKAGYKLGFDPELKIDHAVLPHKLKLSWHLKSWYARGRDGQRFAKQHTLSEICGLTLRSFAGSILKFPYCTFKLFFRSNYFWQNLVWDLVSPLLFRFGQLKGEFS